MAILAGLHTWQHLDTDMVWTAIYVALAGHSHRVFMNFVDSIKPWQQAQLPNLTVTSTKHPHPTESMQACKHEAIISKQALAPEIHFSALS